MFLFWILKTNNTSNHHERAATLPLTHRVVFAVLTEHLGGDPALSSRHARPSTETVAAHCQLLTQAKVWDHGPDPTVGIGHGDQDIVGFQVSVDWRKSMKQLLQWCRCCVVIQKQPIIIIMRTRQWFSIQGWIPMLRECRWASPDMVCWRSITGSSPWRLKSFLSTY